MSREIKYSGIEWIGKIPNDWDIKNLKLAINKEKNFDKNNLNVLSLTLNGIIKRNMDSNAGMIAENYENHQTVKKGQLVFCPRDLDGGLLVGVSEFYGCISNLYMVLNNTKYSNVKYLEYYIRAIDIIGFLINNSFGMRYSYNFSQFSKIPCLYPKVSTQTRIVEYLDKKCSIIDKVIKENKKNIEQMEEYKRALITKYTTIGIFEKNNYKSISDTLLERIPIEWYFRKMNYICSSITDYVASGSFASLNENVKYRDEEDYAMLVRTVDISDKRSSAKPVYIDEHSYNFLKNSNLFGGEIILPNIGASVGDVYIVPNIYQRMSLGPNSIMLKTKYNDKYYYYLFLGDYGRTKLINLSNSCAQPKFNKTELRQMNLPIPPLEEQKRIVNYLDKRCAKIEQVISKRKELIEQLEEYKKSLIYECVTGKKEI